MGCIKRESSKGVSFAKETYVQKTGVACQAPCLAPPSLPLWDMQQSHTPLPRLSIVLWERERVGACAHTLLIASEGGHTLPLLHSPPEASGPLMGLAVLLGPSGTEKVGEVAALNFMDTLSLSLLCPLGLAQCRALGIWRGAQQPSPPRGPFDAF